MSQVCVITFLMMEYLRLKIVFCSGNTCILTFAWASQGPTLTGKNEEKAQVLTEKIEALVVQV